MDPMTATLIASAIGAAGAAASPGPMMAPISPTSPLTYVLDGGEWVVSTSGSTARQDVQRIEGEPASGIGAQVAAAAGPARQAVADMAQYVPWALAALVAVAALRRAR